jgi:hypothetical protein
MTDVSALDCSDTVVALPFRKASKTEVEWVLSAVAANNGGTFHFRTEDGRTVVVVYMEETQGDKRYLRAGAAIHTLNKLNKTRELSFAAKHAVVPRTSALCVTACGRFLRRPLFLDVVSATGPGATLTPLEVFESGKALRALLTNFFTERRVVKGEKRMNKTPAFVACATPRKVSSRASGAGAGAGSDASSSKRTSKDRKAAHAKYVESINKLRTELSNQRLKAAVVAL